MSQEEPEGPNPKAGQVIFDLMRPITVAQLRAYVEGTGWTLWANHFTWENGWSLYPELENPQSWVYIKPNPDEAGKHFKLEVPGHAHGYEGMLQMALERLAAIEETTFVAMICRVRGVQQLVLRPDEKEVQ